MTRRSTVHQAPPLIRARRPRPAGRAPGRPGRRATCRRRVALKRRRERRSRRRSAPNAIEHVGADLERVAARCRRRARRRGRRGAQPAAVAQRRDGRLEHARRPGRASRHAPRRPRGRPARRTAPAGSRRPGPTQATPGSVVTLASASCDRRAGQRHRPRRRGRRACRAPGAGRPARRRSPRRSGARLRGDARRRRRRPRCRGSSSRTARALTPPARVVISAPTPATRQSGASQSARHAHVASGQAEGCVVANAGSAMQASKTRITVGTWSSRQSMRWALKICGTSTQSARLGVSPWQKRPVAALPASWRSTDLEAGLDPVPVPAVLVVVGDLQLALTR